MNDDLRGEEERQAIKRNQIADHLKEYQIERPVPIIRVTAPNPDLAKGPHVLDHIEELLNNQTAAPKLHDFLLNLSQ